MRKRIITKMIGILAALSVTIPLLNGVAYADSAKKDSLHYQKTMSRADEEKELADILDAYELEVNKTAFIMDPIYRSLEIKDIKGNRDNQLADKGFLFFDVTSNSFDLVEKKLNTSLEEIGLDRDGNYFIVVDNGNKKTCIGTNSAEDGNEGGPAGYNYTYNGKKYSVRTIIVRPGYEMASSDYQQTSYVNLINSKSKDIINNCVNTAISEILDAATYKLGTIASILGLQVNVFGNSQPTTLGLNAGTDWERRFTQVWSEYDKAWIYGSCVEKVNTLVFLSGIYYSNKTNSSQPVPNKQVSKTFYSSKYNNTSWQKEQAVLTYIHSGTCAFDSLGPVKYLYGGEIKITHKLAGF